jgi:hypothetical protein
MHFFNSSRPVVAFDYSTTLLPTPMHVLASPVRRQRRISSHILKRPYRSYMLVLAIALALSAANAWAESDLPEAYREGDIAYISGGIGDDELAAIEAVKNDYNVRVTSADKTGHFRGDTEIVIQDMKRNPLLDVIAQGPIFYAQLPNGRYIIEGISEGQSKTQTIRITTGKSVPVHFSWPISTADMPQPSGE